jgi:hypothetical protein
MNLYHKSILCFLLVSIVTDAIAQDPKTVGLIQYDSLSYNGYTLFSPMASNTTYLIDNCGEKIKEWTFDALPGLLAYLQEDGSLFKAVRTSGTFGAGGSGGKVVHKSWDDKLIWSFIYSNDLVRPHHDFQPLPNGNVLVLAWERKSREEAIQAGRIPSFTSPDGVWFEHIVELKPIGIDSAEIVWEWHVFDHLVQERDPALDNFGDIASSPNRFHVNYNIANPFSPNEPGNPDWMHMNSIQFNESRDEIMLSSRDFNEVYIIDHSTSIEEASSGEGGRSGKGGDLLFRWGNNASYNKGTVDDQLLFAQHHASWIESADSNKVTITVFNNGIGSAGLDISSVEILSPTILNGEYVLSSEGVFMVDDHKTINDREELSFSSPRLSSVQVLKNNNFLIASGNNGRIIEITPDEEMVWDYINPVNNSGPITQGTNVFGNDIFRAQRYSYDYEAFDDKALVPMGVIETDPDYKGCFIIETTATTNVPTIDALKIFPNPVNEVLTIESLFNGELIFELYDIKGKVYRKGYLSGSSQMDMNDLSKGFYFIKIRVKDRVQVFKIVKE